MSDQQMQDYAKFKIEYVLGQLQWSLGVWINPAAAEPYFWTAGFFDTEDEAIGAMKMIAAALGKGKQYFTHTGAVLK